MKRKIDEEKLLEKIKWNLDRSMKIIGLKIESEAKRRCPVDTGRLRNSIRNVVEWEGNTCTLKVGSNVKYARYVEEGTVRHFVPAKYMKRWLVRHGFKGEGGIIVSGKPKPFLRPAFETYKKDIKRLIKVLKK